MLTNDSKLKEVYYQLVELSKQMSQHEESKYEHRSIICYFSAKSVLSTRGYLQMPPGAGKTWVCLLSALYWSQMEKPLKAVYVVLNDGLRDQVLEQADSCGVTIKCILPGQINLLLEDDSDGKKFGFIVDEYYAMLENSSMTPLIINKLPGLFTVGWHHKVIFATGHHSESFKEFLLSHIPEINITYCFDDIKDLRRV